MSEPATGAAAGPLRVLYQDDTVVVVDKPSGLLVHRTPIDARETRFALQMLRDQLGRHVYPVHRLDKGTSGALAFALDRTAARRLAEDFATGRVRKTYLAIVRGWPAPSGAIEHPLDAVEDEILGPQTSVSKESITRFRRLATVELELSVDRYATSRYALVELEPLTGRRHQLRRHLKHLSHPIIGDSTYGKGRHNRLFAERFGSRRLLLACTRLEFRHPRSGDPVAVHAPLSEDFAAVLRHLGWELPAVSPACP